MYTFLVWAFVVTTLLLFFGLAPAWPKKTEERAVTFWILWIALGFCTAMTLVLNER